MFYVRALDLKPAPPAIREDTIRFRRLSYWFEQPITLPAFTDTNASDLNPVQTESGQDAGH